MANASAGPFDSLHMMSYIIKRCDALGIDGINATKLQKLMYCCYGVSLVACGFRLCDESPEAWQYGPVFPRTLRRIKDVGLYEFSKTSCSDVEAGISEDVKSAIDQTLNFFGKYSASKLSAWSHLPGSPWSRASDGGKRLYEQIDDATIRAYFNGNVIRAKEVVA